MQGNILTTCKASWPWMLFDLSMQIPMTCLTIHVIIHLQTLQNEYISKCQPLLHNKKERIAVMVLVVADSGDAVCVRAKFDRFYT